METFFQMFASISSGYVAALYVMIGLLVFPKLRPPLLITVMAALFFVGCAMTHVHIAFEVANGEYPHIPHVVMMSVLHVMQAIGGSAFVYLLLSDRELVVTMERRRTQEDEGND